MLTQVHCVRCDKLLTTTVKSVLGLDRLKAQTPILCSVCATVEEQYAILKAQGEALSGQRLAGERRTTWLNSTRLL